MIALKAAILEGFLPDFVQAFCVCSGIPAEKARGLPWPHLLVPTHRLGGVGVMQSEETVPMVLHSKVSTP